MEPLPHVVELNQCVQRHNEPARRNRQIPVSVTGVASIKWVRPDFTTEANSLDLRSRASASWVSAGCKSLTNALVTATCTDVGNTSLDDCEALTWSLGCTVVSDPAACSAWLARLASTSLVFIFDEVPEPVWKMSMGNWSSCSPAMTWSAADLIAVACSSVITSSSLLAMAHAFLTRLKAWIWAGSSP